LDQSQLCRAATAGVQPPQIDGQTSGHGNNGFFALRADGPRPFG
jgi:hypothetical protein